MRPHPAWPADVPRPRRRRASYALWPRLVLSAAVAAAVLSALSARRGQGDLRSDEQGPAAAACPMRL